VAVVSGSQAAGVPGFGTGVPFQLPMPAQSDAADGGTTQ
jgi:hypothetical protein